MSVLIRLVEEPVKKCIVSGCSNRTNQGDFVGDLCYPCHEYLKTGQIGPTNSFLGDMRELIIKLQEYIK